MEDDFGAWLDSLGERDRGVVMSLRGGANDTEVAERFGIRPEGMKARRRRLAESFEAWLSR